MSILPIAQKDLYDSHEARAFMQEGMTRPDGSLAFRLYGVDDGLTVPPQNPLALYEQDDGWLLIPGFLDGVEIQGTGFFSNVAGCRLVIQATISYEYGSLPTGGDEGPPQYFNYKTGKYLIDGVVVALLREGETIPPEERNSPGSDEAGSGLYTEISYREIQAFSAAGIPGNPAGPGWLSIGPDLQF